MSNYTPVQRVYEVNNYLCCFYSAIGVLILAYVFYKAQVCRS